MSADMDRKVPTPGRRARLAIVAAASLGAIGLASLLVWLLLSGARPTVRTPRQTVTIDAVQSGVFHDFTPLRGKVVPHDTVFLDALEGGQVASVVAHGGDQVRAGQPLLVFHNTELELDVLDREGRLIESMTELQTFEKQLEDTRLANEKAAAEIDYNVTRLSRAADRRRTLAAKDYVSAESNDQIHDELAYDVRIRPLQAQSNDREEAMRLRQLPQIHAELASLQQSLRITRGKLDDLAVKAPVSGQLADLVDTVGQNFNRGDRLGEIVADTGYKVSAGIDEYYLGRVKVGQTAAANIDGRNWKLRVTRVYPEVKDGAFTVDLEFVGSPPPGLLPGEAVDGRLSLGGDKPALVMPAGPFLDRTGGNWVMVVDPGGRTAERRRITIGRRNAEQVEILSGLKVGDRVITSDYAAFEKVDRVDLTG
jgi:HlyD family secretion protein